MSKVETTSKVSLELTTKMNLARRGASAKLSFLDIVHKPLHSLEKVKEMMRMDHEKFKHVLNLIEVDITREERVGGNKVVTAPES